MIRLKFKRVNLCCVCACVLTIPLTGHCPFLCLSLGLSVPWDTTVLKLGQLVTLKGPLTVQVKGRTMSLALSQKPEMIKLSEEDMSKVIIDWQLDLLHQTISQVANAKRKSLKEMKSATPVNTWMIKRVKQPYCLYRLSFRLLWWFSGKESACQCIRSEFNP